MTKFLNKFAELLDQDLLGKVDTGWFSDPPFFSSLSTLNEVKAWVKSSCPSEVYKAISADPVYGYICDDTLRSLAESTDSDKRNYLIHLVRIIDRSDATVEIDGDVVSIIFPKTTTKQQACDLLADITGLWNSWDNIFNKKKVTKSLKFKLESSEKILPLEKEKLCDMCKEIGDRVITLPYTPYLFFVNPNFIQEFSASAMHCPLAQTAAELDSLQYSAEALDRFTFLGEASSIDSIESSVTCVLFQEGRISGELSLYDTADQGNSSWTTADTVKLVAAVAILCVIIFLLVGGYLQEAVARFSDAHPILSKPIAWLGRVGSLKKKKGKDLFLKHGSDSFSSDDFYTLCRSVKVTDRGHCQVDGIDCTIIDYDSTMPFHLKVKTPANEKYDLYVKDMYVDTTKDSNVEPISLVCYQGTNLHKVKLWVDPKQA